VGLASLDPIRIKLRSIWSFKKLEVLPQSQVNHNTGIGRRSFRWEL
jgi:hypothetical protein